VIGRTLTEAREVWATRADVICPGCEKHVEEEDSWEEYFDEVWHRECVQGDRRIQYCIAREEADYPR
jgi:hypothetical protein